MSLLKKFVLVLFFALIFQSKTLLARPIQCEGVFLKDENDYIENTLIPKAQAGDSAPLVQYLVPLVDSITNRVWPRYSTLVERDNLKSSGFIGLLRAIKNWNPEVRNGAKFVTYAGESIKGEIMEHIRETDPLSRRQRSHLKDYYALEDELSRILNKPIDQADLLELIQKPDVLAKLSPDSLQTVQQIIETPESFLNLNLDISALAVPLHSPRTDQFEDAEIPFSSDSNPEIAVQIKEIMDHISNTARRMADKGFISEEQYYVFVANIIYGIPQNEIARTLKTDAPNVSRDLKRARKVIRENLPPGVANRLGDLTPLLLTTPTRRTFGASEEESQ